jgi:hypothetical protein
MDWQKSFFTKKVEVCAFKEHKKGGKYGDKICAIASTNVSPGSVGITGCIIVSTGSS